MRPHEDRKIFPRNLTARAAKEVQGNPATSRPESAVEVSSPGLEFDTRNLEQRFFPGLVFDFQRLDGAILADIDLTPQEQASGLTRAHCFGKDRLYLWAMLYRTADRSQQPSLFGFPNLDGMGVWRRVRDLPKGERIAILLGVGAPVSATILTHNDALDLLKPAFDAAPDSKDSFQLILDSAGAVQYVIFAANRVAYLTEDGVIDPQSYAPGELTKSLCAPWIFDFQDCVCFYWSSNKPDMVAGENQPYLEFFRDREKFQDEHDTQSTNKRNERRIPLERLAAGAWETLPIILDDREPSARPQGGSGLEIRDRLFSRIEAIAELRYLATVEHALLVEYLYAHYSVNAPHPFATPPEDREEGRRYTIAREVFRVAVDEMRHFVWVNRLLSIMGDRPSIQRAESIGLKPPGHDNRRLLAGLNYQNVPFHLERLDMKQLKRFMDFERLSQQANDGMYAHLLRSVQHRSDEFEHHDTIARIIKLLVDEGGGHFKRFSAVYKLVERLKKGYLRHLSTEADVGQKAILGLCGRLYGFLLDVIRADFSLVNPDGSDIMLIGQEFMLALDGLIRRLASDGIAFRFDPDRVPDESRLDPVGAFQVVMKRRQELEGWLDGVRNLKQPYQEDGLRALTRVEVLTGKLLEALGRSRPRVW